MKWSQQKLTQEEYKRAQARGIERRKESECWRHLKLPWESCATVFYPHRYWPPLSLTIACTVCLSVSKLLRADQSPFAASAPGCFSSYYTPLPFSISFILHFLSQSSSHCLFYPSFFPTGVLNCFNVNLPTVSLFCHCSPFLILCHKQLLPTPVLLMGRGGEVG